MIDYKSCRLKYFLRQNDCHLKNQFFLILIKVFQGSATYRKTRLGKFRPGFHRPGEKSYFNRYRRKRPKVDASIFDSALSHTRRSEASDKKKKKACPLLDVFDCGQVLSPRLYRLNPKPVKISEKHKLYSSFRGFNKFEQFKI